jgi:polyhydroxybutyrate depolymerase
MIESAHGQTIDFTWTSEGTFNGSPISGTVLTTFSSSDPLDLTQFYATYTGQGGATRVWGPFEITAGNGDQLLGNFEIVGSGPIHQGVNLGAGAFMFTGGTGQFAGATGEGTLDAKITLATFPTSFGDVEHQWRGTLMLVPTTVPGDYNQNGTVDAADYVVWRKTRGQTGAGLAADGDRSGTIDQADYDVWRANFGAAAMTAASLASGSHQVPEPSTFVIATVAIACLTVSAMQRRPVLRPFPDGLGFMRPTHVLLASVIVANGSLAYGQGQILNRVLQHDGLTRRYTVYVPPSYTGDTARPLVLSLHGGTSNALQQMSLSGMNAVADAHDFLVVYPDATGSPAFWNDQVGPSSADDVGFISSLLDELESDYHVDSSRIYSTGLSNGGAMSYYLGNQLSHRVAAIASVAGPNNLLTASRPLPILHMHGTADPIAPINGGAIPGTPIVLPAVAELIEAWRESNHCVGEPIMTQLPDSNTQDGSTVKLIHYEDCECYLTSTGEERTAEVLYYMIEGGGHSWPGHGTAIFGPVNRDIDASTEIWNFFSRHTLPAAMPEAPGDYNQNGAVDAADYVVWRHTSGQTGAGLAADGDRSGMVDDADYGVWRANFGAGGGAAGAASVITTSILAAVPEPTSAVLLVVGAAMRIRDRRRFANRGGSHRLGKQFVLGAL